MPSPPTTAVVRRPSSPELAPFVSALGYLRGEFAHTRERALPTGSTQLLVNLDRDRFHIYGCEDGYGSGTVRTSGAVVQGPAGRPSVIDPAEQRAVLWVSFRLGGAYPFFPIPAEEARDQLVDLDQCWGRDGAVLRDRLLDAGTPARMLRTLEDVLLARAVRPLERDPAVTFAAGALHRGVPVSAVSDRLGWTPKRLRRLFTDQVGLTPKRFGRVRRFQRLLRAVGTRLPGAPGAPGAPGSPGGGAGAGVDWARAAAECGYHDQAHLIHEFRAFAGMTPGAYVPRSPDELNHVPL
jgi:AraC-like DNA-binding protein